MRNIKVQKLTPEAFAPFGKVLTTEGLEAGGNPASHLWYPQVSVVDRATSINLMEVVPREFVCQKFEAHDHTAENLIPMTGGVIVTVIPKGELTADRMAAFYVPQGQGVSIDPSVWHFVPFPIGTPVMCSVIFANGTSSTDIYFDELPEAVGLEL